MLPAGVAAAGASGATRPGLSSSACMPRRDESFQKQTSPCNGSKCSYCYKQTTWTPLRLPPPLVALSLGSRTGSTNSLSSLQHHLLLFFFVFFFFFPSALTYKHAIIKTFAWPHFSLQLAPHFSTPLYAPLLERIAIN